MATDKALAAEIKQFVDDHPNGWVHEEWAGFLHHLGHLGHDVSDQDALGLGVEHERLVQVLGRMEIKGLGPKRAEAIASHYGTLWNLMGVSSEEMVDATGIPQSVARQIADTLQ